MDNPIVLQNVSKLFTHPMKIWQKVEAVSNLSITIRKGEITGIVGHNGAGKTTTLKMIMGFIRPTSGTISLFGKEAGSPEALQHIGFLPEHPYFYSHLTAWEILTYFGSLSGMSSKNLATAKERVLKKVGLYNDKDRPLRTFSKGMLQRIGIAQAIIHDPELIILDEPMSGLDPAGRREVKELILELKKQGKSVVLSSHILSDIEILSDRILVLTKGKVESWGTLKEIIPTSSVQWIFSFDVPDSEKDALFAEIKDIKMDGAQLSIVKQSKQEMNETIKDILSRGYDVYSAGPVYPTLEEIVFEKKEVNNA
ncbi:ABC transporter ATP-binding protein [bacterium]|nr:ABC transporter ATP-binding protein [bacterium]